MYIFVFGNLIRVNKMTKIGYVWAPGPFVQVVLYIAGTIVKNGGGRAEGVCFYQISPPSIHF